MPRHRWSPTLLAVALLALAGASPHGLLAQRPARAFEPRGFDFKPEGVWRGRARRVFAARRAALARGDFASLNGAMRLAPANRQFLMGAGGATSPTAITGVLRVPVFLVRFKNTDTLSLRAPAVYDTILLGAVAPQGRPYTVRTFYEEMSHGLLSVQGIVMGWIALDSNDSWYAGPGTCDGICFQSRVAQLIKEAVQKAPPGINWGDFDNDGPDGMPNSGDDDGEVDVVWLVHPKPGGECGYSGDIWAHRFYYSAWTGASLPTSTVAASSAHPGNIQIDNYSIQSGVGGITNAAGGGPIAGCDPNAIMPPGTVAHETGHGLGLPDLYDTNPTDQDASEGIGEWGLMGSGNWSRQGSPAHMEAFSLAQLGWVNVQPLIGAGSYHVGPVETSDSVLYVRPTVANPRGEYFLLENRQALLADTAMITKHGGGGLLVWHIDSTQYATCTLPFNCVNTGPIHGVALVQADGLDNLGSSTPGVTNRGDAGDPYPGSRNNTALTPRSAPAAAMNSDGSAAGIAVDSIVQVVPNGAMQFRLRLGGVTTVKASDPAARILVSGTAYARFQDLFNNGDTATISADSTQLSADGRTRFTFASWSDAGARSHLVTLSAAGGSYVASVTRELLLSYLTSGPGSVAATPVTAASGAFLKDGDTLTLVATPAAGKIFAGWSGDTSTLSTKLHLAMTKPWSVTATFVSAFSVDAVVTQYFARNGALNVDQIHYLDLLGNANGRLDIGDITAWLDKTFTTATPEQLRRLMTERGP